MILIIYMKFVTIYSVIIMCGKLLGTSQLLWEITTQGIVKTVLIKLWMTTIVQIMLVSEYLSAIFQFRVPKGCDNFPSLKLLHTKKGKFNELIQLSKVMLLISTFKLKFVKIVVVKSVQDWSVDLSNFTYSISFHMVMHNSTLTNWVYYKVKIILTVLIVRVHFFIKFYSLY